MPRILSLTLLLLMILAAPALPASARWNYCSSDPIFEVDGRQVNVVVELAPYEIKGSITSDNPVRTVLTAPEDTDPRLVEVKGDFAEAVEVRETDRNKIRIDVEVPQVPGLEHLRVTVYVDGQLERVVSTGANSAHVTLPWR